MNNDLISREAWKNLLLDSRPDDLQQSDINFFTGDIKVSLKFVLNLIDNAPTVELTELCKDCRFLKDCETCYEKLRPQGEWIEHSCYKDVIICSNCNSGDNRWHKDFKFCPNCGASMKGGTE